MIILIENLLQIKSVRIGVVASGGLVWMFQHLPDIFNALVSPADIDQSTDHDPDHVSEETGTGDGDLEDLSSSGKAELGNVPDLIGIFLEAGGVEGT